MLQDPGISDALKAKIRKKGLGEENPQEDKKLEEEAIRCMMWLNTERATLFFAKHVIICEGPTEKVLLEYLIENNWPELREKHIYFADALGKFSIHRFMTLLSKLGIKHSVLMDRDKDADIHQIVNNFIERKRTEHTNKIKPFDKDLEEFLGIPNAPRPDLKPLHVLSKLRAGEISDDKVAALRSIVNDMLNI
jgi:predicted ATP-dependent endonuclease of OLD family